MLVTDFVSEIKRVENYPDFEKLAHVTHHDLQGFIIKNIEGESMEGNDHTHILWRRVCCVNKSKCCIVSRGVSSTNYECCQRFHKT